MIDTAVAEASQPVVAVEGLRVEFDTDDGVVVGVKDVSFRVAPGETVCVVGESGSGKSVTSLSLMRLVEFGGGRITEGRLLLTRPDDTVLDLVEADTGVMQNIRGNEIGMIFQEPMTSLNPVFTIERQLTDGLRVHRGLDAAAARKRAVELMQEVRIPEPEKRLSQYPHELSGGMRQRVMIAMAMACRPRLLIADEPTTALDVTIQAEILALIDRLKTENGMAVLFITHDMAVVAQMADRVVVMFRGDIVEQGPVEEIFAAPKEEYTRALLAAVPRLGDMRGKAAPEPLRIPGAAEVAIKPAKTLPAESGPLLEVRNLVTQFPIRGGIFQRHVANVHAVENVSFTLARGETMALVGESGCGKSTCGRSILRLIEPTSGEVKLEGRDLSELDDAALRAARRNMQMVFQDPFASLNPFMRLKAQVAEPLTNFGLARGAKADELIAELFERVELPLEFMRRFPHELSGGQRQRVAIARALAVNPKLIVADEAVSALDVSVQAQVLNLMMSLQEERGLSYLFISHDMAVVERVSHRVGVMYLGRLVELGSRAQVFENPQHDYTQKLMSAVPIADPRRRNKGDGRPFRPLPSPIHPVGYKPPPGEFVEVEPGHFVLKLDD